jgi:periplasmic protein CpxP/Spy
MSRFTKTIAVCAAVWLTCAVSAPANAQEAPHPGWQHHHDGMQHDLDKIHAQLNLTADQEQQWQAALAAMKAAHEQQKTAHEQSKQQMQALMQAPVLDLRAIQAAHQQAAEQEHQAHAQVSETWLKFYDTLNTTQKTLVSTTLKAKWQKMAARRAKMEQHWKGKRPDAAASAAQ